MENSRVMLNKVVSAISVLCLWSATCIGQSLSVTDIYDACDSQLGEATLTLSGVSASTYPISARYTNTSTGYTELFTMPAAVHTLYDLDAGEYELEFYLSSITTFTSCLDIRQAEMLFSVDAPDDPVCTTDNIIVSVSGAHPPYSYQWSSGQTTASIYSILPGEYTLSVTDSRGCVFTRSETVESSLDIDVYAYDACGPYGVDGHIYVDGSGLSYCQWSHDPSLYSFSAHSLSPGDYTVTVYSSGSCYLVETVTIGHAAAADFEAEVLEGSCPGWDNGIVKISVPHPAQTSVYPSWGSGDLENYDVTAGSHSIIVQDGCWRDTLYIDVPYRCDCPGMFPDVQRRMYPPCTSTSTDGEIEYVYYPSDGRYLLESSANNQFDNLSAGTYYTRVTHLASGCSVEETITLEALGVPVVQHETVDDCWGSGNGEVHVYVDFDGSHAGVINTSVRVRWDGYGMSPGYITHDPTRPFVLDGLTAGTYCYTVITDCGSYSDCVVVGDVPSLDASINWVGCDGELQLTALPYGHSYEWSTGDTLQYLTDQSYGTYSVTISDDNGCTDVATVTVGPPFCIDTLIPACEGLWDGGVTITLKNFGNHTMSFTMLDSVGGSCFDCPGGYEGTSTLVPPTSDTMVTFTLTDMSATDHYFYFTAGGCSDTIVINPGEIPFERRYTGFGSEDKHTYYCEYEMACRDHPTFIEREKAEIAIHEEGGFTGVPFGPISLFGKCGERHYMCEGDTIASRSTRPIKLKALQLAALLERSVYLGLIPYTGELQLALDRLQNSNPCRDWWICMNDMSTLSRSRIACKHRTTEIIGDGNDCYRVHCRCFGLVPTSYSICGWEFTPDWLEPYVEDDPPWTECDMRTVSIYDLARQGPQLVQKYGEDFTDSELYAFIVSVIYPEIDERMYCATVTYCAGSWDVYDHTLEDVECGPLPEPVYFRGAKIENTCELIDVPQSDSKLVVCTMSNCDTCFILSTFPPVKEVVDLDGLVVKEPPVVFAHSMPPSTFQGFAPFKDANGFTDYSALLRLTDGTRAYWNNDNSHKVWSGIDYDHYTEYFDEGTYIGSRELSAVEAELTIGVFSDNEKVSLSGGSSIRVVAVDTDVDSMFVVDAICSGTFEVNGEKVFEVAPSQNAYLRVVLDLYGNPVAIDLIYTFPNSSEYQLDGKDARLTSSAQVVSESGTFQVDDHQLVTVDESGNAFVSPQVILPATSTLLDIAFDGESALHAMYGFGLTTISDHSFVLHPDYIYVVGSRFGEVALIDSLSVANVDLQSLTCAIANGSSHIGFSFDEWVGYAGNVELSNGGLDIALISWMNDESIGRLRVEGSASDETLVDLVCNDGYLFFGGDMHGSTLYRQLGDLEFEKQNADHTYGFKSHIELDEVLISGRSEIVKKAANKIMTTSDKEVLIYPNPTSEELNVVATGTISKVTLFSIDGQEVHSTYFSIGNIHQVDIRSLDPGLYIVVVRSDDQLITSKVIIL